MLGTDPLDKDFSGARSYLRIGNGNKIREHYTISRGTAPESATEIGDDNYIMTSGHIAHNCRIGNHTVIASCALWRATWKWRTRRSSRAACWCTSFRRSAGWP